MQVVIPVAGLGTRLRPHTHTKPKPLVSVAAKPVLGHILDKLTGLDIEKMVFIVGYLGEQIKAYVAANYDFPTSYVTQKELRGQAHAIRLTREHVTGPVLIIFVDTIFEADLASLERVRSDGVIYVKEVEDPRRFGVVTLDNNGTITRFVEKPSEPVSNLAVVGMYYIKDYGLLFDCIDELLRRGQQTQGEYYLADALQLMVDQGTKLNARTIDVWEDCGTAESLLQTNRYLLRKTVTDGQSSERAIVIPPVSIAPSATIENAVVGPYVSVGEDCRITNSVIGPYVSLANSSEVVHSIIKDSIVNEGSRIETAMLSHSLIGNNAHVRSSLKRLNVGDTSQIDDWLSEQEQ